MVDSDLEEMTVVLVAVVVEVTWVSCGGLVWPLPYVSLERQTAHLQLLLLLQLLAGRLGFKPT